MLHEPSVPQGKDLAVQYKTRLGAYLFFVYAAVYAGFVGINLLSPGMMEKSIVAGLNLAVVYGLGLIVLAFILAILYNAMCQKEEKRVTTAAEKSEV